ncbi:hypothetical protein [Archaeoglobus sp.]
MKPAALLVLSLMVAAPLGLVLEDVADQLYLHVMEFGRMLRIVSDKAYDNAVKAIMEKYEHRMRELEQKGRTETAEYMEVRKRYERFAEIYVEETDNDLEIVDYSVDLDGGVASVTLKNVDDRPIDYVTGFVKVIGPDGKVSEFKAPFPVPLNLKPNETKTYTVEIWGWSHGTYTIHAEVWRWNGDRILEATVTLDV